MHKTYIKAHIIQDTGCLAPICFKKAKDDSKIEKNELFSLVLDEIAIFQNVMLFLCYAN